MTDWQFKLWAASRKDAPLYDPEAAEYAKVREAAARLVRPAYRERTDGRTRHKAYVCPAKMFRRHPDKTLRALANAQAAESHAHHGPCRGECKTSLSMFCKNDTTMRIAIGKKRAEAWRVKTANA